MEIGTKSCRKAGFASKKAMQIISLRVLPCTLFFLQLNEFWGLASACKQTLELFVFALLQSGVT